jgi:threonine/homoserine/homoserine lactone efflux protein
MWGWDSAVDAQLFDLISRGTLLGLAAGFSPGPLTLLVVGETLRHGLRSGLQVAIAPLLTDIPIILLAALLLGRLTGSPLAFGALSLTGGLFLLWLGYASLKVGPVMAPLEASPPRSIRKGIAANLLNPNPYLFWTGVGVPTLLSAREISWAHAAAFIGAFFFFIVGSKALLARLVDGSRAFMQGRVYLGIMRLLGVLLMVYGVLLLRDGWGRMVG